jgi:hypothetical protein
MYLNEEFFIHLRYNFFYKAFCDSKCRFLSVASKLVSSSHDNTHYIATKLSDDIKSGKLHPDFNVVLDEAYPSTPQEMSPWKGRHLSQIKDAFNYYLSLQRQCIERAFGILIQRWGIFWRPLRVKFLHRIMIILATCRLHNICVMENVRVAAETLRRGFGSQYGFGRETDHNHKDKTELTFTSLTGMFSGYRSDAESCPRRDQLTNALGHQDIPNHRDRITRQISIQRLKRPRHSQYSRDVKRKK